MLPCDQTAAPQNVRKLRLDAVTSEQWIEMDTQLGEKLEEDREFLNTQYASGNITFFYLRFEKTMWEVLAALYRTAKRSGERDPLELFVNKHS